MNRKRLLVIGTIAVVAGGFTSWFVHHTVTAKLAPGVAVVVAARDLQPGERINDGDLRIVSYHDEFLPLAVMQKKERALGRWTVSSIAKGEFVLPSKMSPDRPDDSLTAQIPVGMRAVQLSVNDLEPGSIKPGDRADVLVTGDAPGTHETETRTAIGDVRLLAIGTRAVTLVASPEDAEKLTLATQEGRIKLVFRNPRDPVPSNTPAITRWTLYGGTQPAKTKVKPVRQLPDTPHFFNIEILEGDRPPENKTFKQ
jgi:pilus assembly protein CpaB